MPHSPEEWRDGFLTVGNHLALDFLNTALIDNGRPLELLPDTAALERWCLALGLIPPERKARLHRWCQSNLAAPFLERLLAFRSRLRSAVFLHEEGRASTAFIKELNALLLAYPVHTAIVDGGNGALTLQNVVAEPVPHALWTALASETAALFTTIDPARLRKCESCAVHFQDISKKGSRRWCSMNLCGNKLKVAAYQKRKAQTPHPGQ